MGKIIYEDAGHKYRRESDGVRLMPVSTFYKIFNPTNWVHNVEKSAAQRYFKPKRYKELKDAWEEKGGHILDPAFIKHLLKLMDKKTFKRLCLEVRAEWDEKGNRIAGLGTIEHAREEQEAIELGYSINPANGKPYKTILHGKKENGDNETVVEKLCDLETGFYPEALLSFEFPYPIFSKTMNCEICGIAGQTDKLYKDEYAYLGDYKFTEDPLTNFGITYKNFGQERHTGPWSDRIITKISGYEQQLNIYGWMLDEGGVPPVDLRIHNHGRDIPVAYDKSRVSEAVSMLFNEGL